MPNIEDKSRHLAMVFLSEEILPAGSSISDALDLEVAGFTQGFTFILAYNGDQSDAASDLTLLLEDSPDGSVWTTIPASKIAGTLPDPINTASGFIENNTALTLGVVGTARFLRANASVTGGTGSNFTLFGYGVTNVQPPIIGEGVTILF